ncbi:MAG: hypothetical protein ACLS3Y_02505 [Collinsella sp.]
MTHAYSEMYLDDAMRTLGEAVDFALCDPGLNPAELTILSNAFEMKQFEHGIPRVVCGMSGDELARDIIAHAGLSPSNAGRLSVRPFASVLGGLGFGLCAMDVQLVFYRPS